MAMMHPETLDKLETESSAERFLFYELSRQLDDSFHVFHSVTWTGSRNIRGECDFVIFKKDTGFLTLEVKGGSIEVIDNAWYSVNRRGERLRIKDPVRQARYAQYAFKDLYHDRFGAYFSGIWTWAVCFPETRVEGRILHRDLNRYNVLDVGGIDRIYEWIMALFQYTRPGMQGRIHEEQAANFISLFSVNATFARSMLFAMKRQREELESVDQFQDYLLNLFDDKRRVGFQGAAGTGKTWLALKKAMRLSEEGKRILFLCFSTNLKEYLGRKLAGISSVTIETFHSFAITVLADFIHSFITEEKLEERFWRLVRMAYEKAGEIEFFDRSAGTLGFLRWLSTASCELDLSGELHDPAGRFGSPLDEVLRKLLPPCMDDPTGMYSHRIPAALELIFDEFTLRDQFDAIIIDEAQDFEDSWCNCINYFFRNQSDRIVYIFYDDNQSIFLENKSLPVVSLLATPHLGDYIFRLRNNIRNTSAIHHFAVAKTGLGTTSQPMEIRGIPPEEVSFDDPEQAVRYISDTIRSLVKEHGIARSSITILSNAAWEYSAFSQVPEVGGLRLEPELVAHSKGIRFRTVSQFKGLESDAVILLVDYGTRDRAKHHAVTPELVYIGCTRAKYILYVVNLRRPQ